MQTLNLYTILISAYLSAMLASNAAPLRGNATLASPIDQAATQKAFQGAVDNLAASGWATALAAAPIAARPTARMIPTKAAPAMTDELMTRLIEFTRNLKETAGVSQQICRIFELCDGTKDMPLKMVRSARIPDERHFFGLPIEADSRDILIMRKVNGDIEAFLTDKTATLRAAAILSTDGNVRLIMNERAKEQFKAEMALFAAEAADLPPTGVSVAGN